MNRMKHFNNNIKQLWEIYKLNHILIVGEITVKNLFIFNLFLKPLMAYKQLYRSATPNWIFISKNTCLKIKYFKNKLLKETKSRVMILLLINKMFNKKVKLILRWMHMEMLHFWQQYINWLNIIRIKHLC